jgi:hypothetical protein
MKDEERCGCAATAKILLAASATSGTGKLVQICGGHKREGERALPGEICNFALSYHHREVRG